LKSIHELVREYDFKFIGSCSCNGYKTVKYTREVLKLEWRKSAGTFRLYTPDKMFSNRWEKIENLQFKIEKYVLEQKKV
jgi:hypothetical protein